MASNPLTAGLGKMILGVILLAVTAGLWLLTGRVWIWLGAVGFVLLLWGLAGGGNDNGYNQ